MDEDMFRVKAVKSYRNTHKSGKTAKFSYDEITENYEPLTTKDAVKFLLEGSLKYKVCRYCLNIASPLSELDEIFEVARKGAIYKVTLRVMIASVHPFKVVEDPNFPDKICMRCVESAISSYMFSQQCERAERALRNCFDDIHTKFEKLDPLQRPKKRGRQKLNPNPNVLYSEHKDVIDYAEPIIHLINVDSTNMQDEKTISPLECPKCWQVLPDLEMLLNHQSMHPKSMWYSCRLCGQSFINYRFYKRHIRDEHKDGQIVVKHSDINTSFRCNDCGITSSSFGEHLQHIEKHKFKTTFEHLLDRSMNRLCAVCLEKKPCTIHMNETIQFNGGYPGINNEQAIYNIVSSTFPEPKSYKYQELLIPTRASIMTITKRMDTWQTKSLKPNYVKKIFKFCNPTILSTLNVELETLYIFIFSIPWNLTDKLTISPNPSLFTVKDFNSTVDLTFNQPKYNGDINDSDILTSKDYIDNYEYLPENSNTDIETVVEMVKVEESTAKLCKVCWIFNKPSCNDCVNNPFYSKDGNQTIMNNNEKLKEEEKCKFCWLFAAVDKCDYCKKNVKSLQENNFTVTQASSDVLEKQSDVINIDKTKTEVNDDNDKKSTFDDELKKGTRKRKIHSDLTVTPKCKWQCRICLTNNDKNTRTCFCCDFDNNVMDNNIKFTFGGNKNLFEYNVQNNKPTIQGVTNIENVSNTVHENRNLIPEVIPTCYNSIPADIVPMDVEIINPNILQNSMINTVNNNFNQISENMEVIYEDVAKPIEARILLPANLSYVDENIVTLPSSNTINSTQFIPQNMPFQFTIGTSTTASPKQRNQRDFRRRIIGRK